MRHCAAAIPVDFGAVFALQEHLQSLVAIEAPQARSRFPKVLHGFAVHVPQDGGICAAG